jgi:hypothetical protein
MRVPDKLKVTILDDGTLRVESPSISAANHANAEGVFKLFADIIGGETTRERAGNKHGHAHVHRHGEHSHSH